MSDAYSAAGVNLRAGYESVDRIKKHIAGTNRLGVMAGIGGFGGLFDLSALDYRQPVLVSGTDGVGTKLLIAIAANKHDTIGIDCVAMCVNDIVVQGAEPLYFLDYIACGKNDPAQIEAIVAGVANGCEQTAEMPDMYADGHYDLAGFCVGVVEKDRLITGEKVAPGDVLIGLPSNGIHSNGYSLVRKILFKDNDVALSGTLPPQYGGSLGESIGDAVLKPTRIYVKPILVLLREVDVHGMANITGGGFFENIPRALPDGCGAIVEKETWRVPPIFRYLQDLGGVPEAEMYNVFNMGIGMVLIVAAADVDQSLEILRTNGEKPMVIGKVIPGSGVEVA
jgi:phosphoribosylformylglycinamidine cyclo-ligase